MKIQGKDNTYAFNEDNIAVIVFTGFDTHHQKCFIHIYMENGTEIIIEHNNINNDFCEHLATTKGLSGCHTAVDDSNIEHPMYYDPSKTVIVEGKNKKEIHLGLIVFEVDI